MGNKKYEFKPETCDIDPDRNYTYDSIKDLPYEGIFYASPRNGFLVYSKGLVKGSDVIDFLELFSRRVSIRGLSQEFGIKTSEVQSIIDPYLEQHVIADQRTYFLKPGKNLEEVYEVLGKQSLQILASINEQRKGFYDRTYALLILNSLRGNLINESMHADKKMALSGKVISALEEILNDDTIERLKLKARRSSCYNPELNSPNDLIDILDEIKDDKNVIAEPVKTPNKKDFRESLPNITHVKTVKKDNRVGVSIMGATYYIDNNSMMDYCDSEGISTADFKREYSGIFESRLDIAVKDKKARSTKGLSVKVNGFGSVRFDNDTIYFK